MSDYAASVLAKGQTVVTQKFNAPEQRRQMPTIMEQALKNTEISIPNASELRLSPLRVVDVNYYTNIAAGSATAKVALHTGTYGDSQKINVAYVQHVETFSLPQKLYYNNVLTYQNSFNNLLGMKWKNLRTRHDNSALAFLYANRVQLSNATIDPLIASSGYGATGANGGWNQTNFALEISLADQALFLQKAKTVMAARFYTGPYDVYTDLVEAAKMEYQLNQGQGNAANTSFQFGDANIITTQSAISTNYTAGQAIITPAGMLSGLNWNEGLNVKGLDAGMNNVGKFGTSADPFGSGAIGDVSYYSQRADTSANTTGGSPQDVVDQWEIALTIGYVLPPLSLTGDSVAMLFGQLTA